jgi:hypothetical protein
MANPTSEFQFDAFLSHSAMDKAVVRPLAERLRQDGLKVWPVPPKPLGVGGFDEWMLAPGDNIPAKIEKGSAHSNILRNEGGQMCGGVEPTPFRPGQN